MTLYLSGAMTGKEHFNFPYFFEIEDVLTKKGYYIINPARLSLELLSERLHEKITEDNYYSYLPFFDEIPRATYIAYDIKYLLSSDAIVMLDGWNKSKGSILELKVAQETGKMVFELDANYNLVPLDTKSIGMKFDKKKIRMELVDMEFVKGVAEVLTFGAMKYDDDSWKYVDNAYNRYFGALLRHIAELQSGKMIDEESGLNVIDHISCNVMFLRYFLKKDGKIK